MSRKSDLKYKCHNELLENSDEYRELVNSENVLSEQIISLNKELIKVTVRKNYILRKKLDENIS